MRLQTYISPKIMPGLSGIHGVGIFANEPVMAGELLLVWGGEVIGCEDARSGEYQGHSIWPLADGYLLAYPKSDPDPHAKEEINHSCDANTWLASEKVMVARRKIEAGEELTLDQGTWNTDDLYTDEGELCSCGAPDCRMALTGRDWKLLTVQERYAGHFHPVIARQI